jgi:hypothetical protein
MNIPEARRNPPAGVISKAPVIALQPSDHSISADGVGHSRGFGPDPDPVGLISIDKSLVNGGTTSPLTTTCTSCHLPTSSEGTGIGAGVDVGTGVGVGVGIGVGVGEALQAARRTRMNTAVIIIRNMLIATPPQVPVQR